MLGMVRFIYAALLKNAGQFLGRGSRHRNRGAQSYEPYVYFTLYTSPGTYHADSGRSPLWLRRW